MPVCPDTDVAIEVKKINFQWKCKISETLKEMKVDSSSCSSFWKIAYFYVEYFVICWRSVLDSCVAYLFYTQ